MSDDCPICFEDLDNASSRTPDCGHRLHTSCMARLRSANQPYSNNCPTCRVPFRFSPGNQQQSMFNDGFHMTSIYNMYFDTLRVIQHQQSQQNFDMERYTTWIDRLIQRQEGLLEAETELRGATVHNTRRFTVYRIRALETERRLTGRFPTRR